jgi:UDP-N-acetylmuramoylalanine--D-glutamate ligase
MEKSFFGVFGLGISGAATIKFMLERGYKFIAWDDSFDSMKSCQERLKISEETLNIHDPESQIWGEVEYLIASPGIPNLVSHRIFNKLRHDVKIICDVELFYMHFPNQKYIAITGTNGKSTTTKLTEHVLNCNGQKAIACGNIGVPILAVVPKKNDVIVLELSSYQLELIREFRPHIASILNITPDHIDHHGSMEAYIEAKKKIFLNQTPDDFLILNIDDPFLIAIYESLAKESNVNLISISVKKVMPKGISIIGANLYDAFGKKKIRLPKNKNLRGEHNLANILASFAMVSAQNKLLTKNFIKAVRTYPGLAHRLQFLGEANGIEFINDSKATNAASTQKALISLKGDGDIFWIGGGLQKEEGIEPIKEDLKNIKYAFLIGKAQSEFANLLDEIKVKYKLSNTLDIAFRDAMEIIKATNDKRKKILLLSPACASFDQWKNFEERGKRFIQLVGEEIKK